MGINFLSPFNYTFKVATLDFVAPAVSLDERKRY